MKTGRGQLRKDLDDLIPYLFASKSFSKHLLYLEVIMSGRD